MSPARTLALVSSLVLASLLLAFVVPAPAGAQGTSARTVTITVNDTMRFDPSDITAKAGERLTVVLKDVGRMPKPAMAHNFVLLKKGANPKDFVDKSVSARETDFISPAVKSEVLANTSLVGPGETTQTTFEAPKQAGSYTFLCSFPGHFALGMKGTLTVK